MEELEHVGPGSQSPLTSFWPGWSSGPCPSLMQRARTGAAARRPSTSVTATSPHIPTTLSATPVAAPQQDRSPAHFAVLLEFVISCLLYSDRAASTSANSSESLGRPVSMTGPFFPGGRERDVRAPGPPAPRLLEQALCHARLQKLVRNPRQAEGVKLADMHDVMASCAHVTRLERSDAACDRMPHTLRHSECQVGGRSGDDVGGATRSFEGCQPLFLATEHEGVVELLVFSECRVDLLNFRRPVRSHAISLQG